MYVLMSLFSIANSKAIYVLYVVKFHLSSEMFNISVTRNSAVAERYK